MIQSILVSARRQNRRDGLSGLLLVGGNRFLQALEGDTAKINSAYDRIKAAKRHYALVQLSRRKFAKRDFAEWDMSFELACAPLGGAVGRLTARLDDRVLKAQFEDFAQRSAAKAACFASSSTTTSGALLSWRRRGCGAQFGTMGRFLCLVAVLTLLAGCASVSDGGRVGWTYKATGGAGPNDGPLALWGEPIMMAFHVVRCNAPERLPRVRGHRGRAVRGRPARSVSMRAGRPGAARKG